MSSVSPSISPTLATQSHSKKSMFPFHTSTTTTARTLLNMAKLRQTPKPISISAHWVPNYPRNLPSKTPVPPEFPSRPQTDPPSVPLEMPGTPNVPDFDPVPLERPADPPRFRPGRTGPDFPSPPMPSPEPALGASPPSGRLGPQFWAQNWGPQFVGPHFTSLLRAQESQGRPWPSPLTPDAPRPPIPSPPGPDVPKGPPDVYPPNGPDIVPPTPPEIVPIHPTQPDIPPPFNPYM